MACMFCTSIFSNTPPSTDSIAIAERKVLYTSIFFITIFLNPPREAVPNLTALALERTLQLATKIFSQRRFLSSDFKQIPSSAALISQLVILAFLQSTISMPSLFKNVLLKTCTLSIIKPVQFLYAWIHEVPFCK